MEISLIQFLSLSTVSAFLAFCLNYTDSWFKRRKRLKAASLLLLHEVNRHVFWLEQLAAGQNSCIDFLIELPDSEWEKLKYDMFVLDYKDFGILIDHYRNMEAFRAVAKEVQKRNLTRIPLEQTESCLKAALIALKILGKASGKSDNRKTAL